METYPEFEEIQQEVGKFNPDLMETSAFVGLLRGRVTTKPGHHPNICGASSVCMAKALDLSKRLGVHAAPRPRSGPGLFPPGFSDQGRARTLGPGALPMPRRSIRS